MGFIKIVKNKAYFKRFQVKFKRRRDCLTDYYARKRLITQDKNKYKTPKYRLVVRFSNKDIACQIFSADLTHDVCIAAAYAHELPRYGLRMGLTNYAAAYCTGLLLARRVNKKFGLKYEGKTEVTGEDYNVEDDEDGAAPFHAVLDVGLVRTTTGNRVFGALKGAIDGGLNIPHMNGDRRFPGAKKDESGEWSFDPEVHRKYIFGGHVGAYMKLLKEEDEDKFNRQFSKYLKLEVNPDSLEKLYSSVHAGIRKDPLKKRDPLEKGRFLKRQAPKKDAASFPKKRFGAQALSVQQRKGRVKQKLLAAGKSKIGDKAAAAAAAPAEDEAAQE